MTVSLALALFLSSKHGLQAHVKAALIPFTKSVEENRIRKLTHAAVAEQQHDDGAGKRTRNKESQFINDMMHRHENAMILKC